MAKKTAKRSKKTLVRAIRGVLKLPGGAPMTHEIESAGNKPLQRVVGGYFEAIKPFGAGPVVGQLTFWADEDGKSKGLPLNFRHGARDAVVGPVFVTAVGSDGEIKSLSKPQEKAVFTYFAAMTINGMAPASAPSGR